MSVADKLTTIAENTPKVFNAGYNQGYEQSKVDNVKEEQEKTVDITENGTTEVLPDEGKVLSKVTVNVEVEGEPLLFSIDGRVYQKKMHISDNVTSIGDYAFLKCTNLQEVVISDNVTSIGASAFYGTSLYNVDNLLKNITRISTATFREIPTLVEVEIPDNVKYIGQTAFYGCSSLEKVIIRGAEIIHNQAFDVCVSLKTLYLPNTLTDAGSIYSFNGMNLEFVTLENGFNGKNLNLSRSTKYSVDTIVSWGDALYDRTGLDPYTLIIGATNREKLSTEQQLIFLNKNWNLG